MTENFAFPHLSGGKNSPVGIPCMVTERKGCTDLEVHVVDFLTRPQEKTVLQSVLAHTMPKTRCLRTARKQT